MAARAGDWTLTEERLAELLVQAQPLPLDSAAAYRLASHWVAAAALALRSAAGDSLLGSAALEAATWLDRREAVFAADRDSEPYRIAEDVLLGRDEHCMNYIRAWRKGALNP